MLKVLARGTAMVPRHEALPARRYVGRVPVEDGGVIAWVPQDDPSEVPEDGDYLLAVRCGDLWPADEETAQKCGVPFDPNFGEVK